jgi:hypothetical protein
MGGAIHWEVPMRQPHEWPSREQWAEQYQSPYWDVEDCPFDKNYSHRLTDYATPEEIAALTVALKDLYCELGRKLQAANLRIKPSDRQQRGEGQQAWDRRFCQLPQEDKDAFGEASNLRFERSVINDLLTRIRNNKIPNRTRCSSFVPGKPDELVAPFNARYDAAGAAAREAYVREYIAQHQPDDAAWERELERRASIEAWRKGLAAL